jgi:hypothetical protein
MNNENSNRKEETLRGELKQKIVNLFSRFKDWLRPSKGKPLIVQVLIFLIKLPVVLIALALSPVFIIILLIAFFLAL